MAKRYLETRFLKSHMTVLRKNLFFNAKPVVKTYHSQTILSKYDKKIPLNPMTSAHHRY
jgi:hypothetical protein